MEREAEEKRKLEYKIMEKMMQRLTMDKATQYTSKAVEKVRKRIEELVHVTTQQILEPYSGKLSREKTFTNFAIF